MHFVHLRAEVTEGAPCTLPLIMTHGWPSSFVEMLPAARLLADQGGIGDAAGAFDVVVPSLPGFLYSELPQGPFTRRRVAELWHELMTAIRGSTFPVTVVPDSSYCCL